MQENYFVGGDYMQKLYMAVTPDRFELPLAVADTAKELSLITGIPRKKISEALCRNLSGKHLGMKFIKIIYKEKVG